MPTIFTDNQKKAHDILRHLSVTANAGSGKTLVLVHRYVDIVTQTDTQVGEVVAITFTDKAASELKRKIAETIAERLRSPDDLAHRLRLEQVRDRLSSAVIGTIHSFCARMLREHPIESGVDAAFTVLEEIDQRALVQQAIIETFQGILLRGQSELRRSAMNLLDALGKKGLLDVLEFLIAKRDLVTKLRTGKGLYTKTDEEINRFWTDHLNTEARQSVGSPSFAQAVHNLLSVGSSESQAKGKALLQEVIMADDFVSIAKPLSILNDMMFTDRRAFRKRFTDRDLSDRALMKSARAFWGAFDWLASFAEFEDIGQVSALHARLLSLTREIFTLLDLVLDRYESMKREQSALDFDDLLLLTNSLLSNNTVQKSLAKRFKYLMVDEYQDTNALQYEILRKLVSGFESGNLFIVGDPKQSIYGFRNAQVEVFQETEDAIMEFGKRSTPFYWRGSKMEAVKKELEGAVALPDSFRLLGNLVAFVNTVFEPLMRRDGKRYEVDYEPLVLARGNPSPGRVELLVHASSTNKDEEAAEWASVEDECELIARRIQSLLREHYTVYDRKTEEPHPVRHGDIALLLRSRTHLLELEKSLLKQGVPFLVSGGVGFYQTQEIYDLYNYLQFLLNSEDDAALAGILRSPFFELSDAELFEIGLSQGNHNGLSSFWLKLSASISRDDASLQVRRAHRILSSHLLASQRLSPFDLLRKILDDTSWLGAITGTDRREQNKANVEKMLSFAREYGERGFVGLFDFTERFKHLIESHENEGQANIDTGENAVRIMTIHAAKGLEFPVVILPFLHRPFRYDSGSFIESVLGLGFRTAEENEEGENVIFPVGEYLKQMSRARTESEEKRIFYVACTRARDLLVLSGDERAMKRSPSHLRWIYESLGIDSVNSRSRIELTTEVQILQKQNGAYKSFTTERELVIPVVAEEMDAAGKIALEAAVVSPQSEMKLHLDPLSAETKGEFCSASQIQTYFDCPTKFFLIYRLGVEEDFLAGTGSSMIGASSSGERDEHEDLDQISPTLRGTIIHQVLQNVHLSMNQEEVKLLVDTELAKIGGVDNSVRKDMAEEIVGLISTFIQSDGAKRALEPREFRTEYTIHATIDKQFVTGTIDRLVVLGNKTWSVIDYKTDRVTAESLEEHVDRYRRQMEMYAYLVRRLHPAQDSVDCTLLFLERPGAPQVFEFSAEQLDRFEGELLRVLGEIARIEQEGFSLLPRTSPHCPRCGFFFEGRCVLFRHEASEVSPR